MNAGAQRTLVRRPTDLGMRALLVVVTLLAGCASSGDVEKARQESEQAKAKMRAELQQERTLAASMEKESEAKKAEAEKLAKAFGGTSQPKLGAAGPKLQVAAGSITLTAALQNQQCQVKYRTGPSSDAWGLYIAPNTPCSNVTVGAADAVFTAQSPLRPVVIEHGGTLTLLDQTMTLYASSFLIWRGGIMQAGSATNPVQNQITIVMAGNSSPSPAPLAGGGTPIAITTNNTPNARDITVMDGGTLALYGGKGLSAKPDGTSNNPATNPAFINTLYGTKSWTYLASPAGPAKYNDAENVSAPAVASNLLVLANQVDWQVGDWISVATTSFSSHQTEIVQICGIATDMTPDPYAAAWGMPLNVSYLTLCQNLKHYHYGGLVPTPGFFPAGTKQVVAKGGNAIDVGHQAKSFYDDHARNYGIDERAEVALLSRNIKMTSAAGAASDPNLYMGGHVAAMVSSPNAAMPTVQLVGVEIEKFGQPFVGRYPVHLHMLPNGGNVLVQDVSVHHSYNKCYVPHRTPNAKFYNNVCVRTVGQGMYLEDGTNITGNQFMRNHIAGAMAAGTTYSYPRQNKSQYWDGDNLQNAHNQSGAITGATNASPIVVTTTSPVPSNGAQVTVSGVQGNTAANGTWTVANANSAAGTFALQSSTGNGSFSSPTWSTSGLNAITGMAQDATTQLIQIQTQSTPVAGAQVTIAGTNTLADGTWTITNVVTGPPSFELANSQSIPASQYSSYSCCKGTWSASGAVVNASNASPIVITSSSSLNTGAQVTISGVTGNTAANGTWTVMNVDATHFSLQSSQGNGAFTGAAWAAQGASPTWYTVNAIPDTSFSNANAIGNAINAPDVYHPGGFWITNLGNTFVNNSVAGCQAMGRAYWLLAQDQSQLYAYPEFAGNRAHGCYNGLDTQPDAINNIFDPKPTMNGTANAPAPVLLLNDNTVTRSRNRAFWGRGIFFTLHNNRFATNPYGFSLLGGGGPEGNLPGFWGMAHENVIAGMTRNNVERYPGCANTGLNFVQECTDVTLTSGASWGNYPTPSWGLGMNIQGYSYYDGPARIEHNRFVNFRFDPTGIQSDPAARLVTKTDSALMATNLLGQLQGQPQINGSATTLYNGYAGDPATGWIQSNAQSVPPTQYIQDSIWDNVDFKHQVYTEAVNLGVFNDGDKTTVILDKDSQLTGLRVVDGNGKPVHDHVPVSLNSVDYYATDFTVDEPHARGPNDFRATSLMSPHKYATLNIESAANPVSGFRVLIQRDMPAYGTGHPSLFMNGRGQKPIYEPFVMDRMGYTVYGMTGTEHKPNTQAAASFMPQLLFSYTDPAVRKAGDFFVNRIAVSQPVSTPANIKVYRTRRQWGQQYTGGMWPPNYNPPAGNSCDGVFFAGASSWADCINRATNQPPYNAWPYTQLGYPYGMTLSPAADWKSFEKNYKDLMAGTITVATFIANQTYYYDTATNMLYFYMVEDSPTQRLHEPYGTCGGGVTQYAANIALVQQIKSFSDPGSVKAALDASCQAGGGAWQSSSSHAITGATNAKPIVITSPNGLSSDDKVTITGVQGNTAANGTWTITPLDATHFSLNNSDGTSSGAYTTGGTWAQLHPITHASNASPIVVTSPNSVTTGAQVTIAGVQGNTAANGTWTVTAIDATHFSLNNSTGNGAFVTYDPLPDDLFTCGVIGCAAYLVDLSAAAPSAPTALPPSAPPHPISRTDYKGWNQYTLVYGTSAQQPNGLPVVANPAIGNGNTVPADGTPLPPFKSPTDGTAPPAGDRVTYTFLALDGTYVPVTENFPYHCVTTPPWAPVNARETYPPTGGFTYPLAKTVCD